MMEQLLYIMIGGGIGAVLRHVTTSILKHVLKLEHYSTFWVNIFGCFAFGVIVTSLLNNNSTLYYFLISGVVASFTTFSTFEYENINLIAHEKYIEFLKYTTLSCCCGFTAIIAGIITANIINF